MAQIAKQLRHEIFAAGLPSDEADSPMNSKARPIVLAAVILLKNTFRAQTDQRNDILAIEV